ncbi:MAG TPA: hypothetical protein VJH20_05680 [Candidatus Nanoarchaeia archaeon]|nr:hypothetical protein [Candidatus Nanoarchaeia archaeon]
MNSKSKYILSGLIIGLVIYIVGAIPELIRQSKDSINDGGFFLNSSVAHVIALILFSALGALIGLIIWWIKVKITNRK